MLTSTFTIIFTSFFLFKISVEVNGDSRTDVICSADDAGVMVWESKDLDSGNYYDPTDPWEDVLFGFCPINAKWVNI